MSFWINEDGQFRYGIVIVMVLVMGVAIISLIASINIVPAGYRGVKLRFGAVQGGELDPGIYFVIPFAESITNMEVRTQIYETSASAASKDLQDVVTEVALNYHLGPGVDVLYQRLGTEYQDRVIAPSVQEMIKANTAQFNAEELITDRESVKLKIQDGLAQRLQPYGIVVETISITNFTFSPVFSKAIEAKVAAEQDALQAKNVLERVKIEAQQKIESAKGDAEAIRIVNEQLRTSSSYLQFLALQKWDGKLPTVTGGAIPFVPISTNTVPINTTG